MVVEINWPLGGALLGLAASVYIDKAKPAWALEERDGKVVYNKTAYLAILGSTLAGYALVWAVT